MTTFMCGESLERTLLEVMTPGRSGAALSRVPLLGRHGHLTGEKRWAALTDQAAADAVPPDAAGDLDAEEVAGWIAGHYPAAAWPAVVLGSPHGAAVHLAAALGAPWLPASFPVTFAWPAGDPADWRGAMAYGEWLAGRILERNPGVTVRQVHDPLRCGPLSGAAVTLHIRWLTLPAAYRDLLRSRIRLGGAALQLRDLRTWPVHQRSPRFSFQVGSPVGGWSPEDHHSVDEAPRRYAETAGEPAFGADLTRFATGISLPVHRALYAAPAMLSAGVADLHRQWLRAGGADGERCVLESGRQLDPWQTLAGGVVPYWCESAARRDVTAAGWWLAGSEPFDAVTVLPDAPGHAGEPGATLAQWRSLTAFARTPAPIDRRLATHYPALPVAPAHATRVLAAAGGRPGTPPAMTVLRVVRGLQRTEAGSGILVS